VPKTNRKLVVIGVMLANFLAALDVTIVGTAMPTIIGTLGGLPIMSWVFSAFLLTSTVTVPIYGKLSDLYGRKVIFVIGAFFIALGSVLCALSETMLQLIIFRAVQGLGAAGIMAVAVTIIGDIFTPAERGKMQGYFSAVWGISALMGPLLGGLIINFLTWQWIFYINVPVAIVAVLFIWFALHEGIEKKRHQIDYLGAITLTASMTALLLALLEGGAAYPWVSPQILGLFGAFVLLLIWFWFIERKAAEPMIPLDLLQSRLITVSLIINFLVGGVLIGVSSYMPSYVQGVLGGSATMAGLTVMPLSIGWPLASFIGGPRMMGWGFRKTTLMGMVLIAVSAVLLSFTSQATGVWYPMAVLFIMGIGMGLVTLALTVGIQSAVEWNRRGIATATLQFIRSVGQAVSVALMGAFMNARIISELTGHPRITDPLQATNDLLDPDRRAALPADLMSTLTDALDSGLHQAFLLLAVLGVLALVFMAFYPRSSQPTTQESSPR